MVDFAQPWALIPGALALWFVFWIWRTGRGAGAQLSPARSRMVLLLRTSMVALLFLSVAGLRQSLPSERVTVIFLVDRSLSARNQEQFQKDFLTQALAAQKDHNQVAIVTFGGDAALELPPSKATQPPIWTALVDRQQSDLAAAIRFSCACVPAGSAARLVILSDGQETRGKAALEAEVAHRTGVEICSVPLPEERGSEVLVESVSVPPRVRKGAPFDVSVTVVSSHDGQAATLTLQRNGRPLAREKVVLEKGRNVFLIPQQLQDEVGVARYEAQIQAASDQERANNQASEATVLEAASRLLYVTKTKSSLPAELRRRGLEVEVREPFSMPSDLAQWQGFQAVVLDDVSALELSPIQLDWLTSMIRETGLGLTVLGGPQSYGAGGYYQSTLAEAFPVSLDVKRRKNSPLVGIVHCIDKSGSMSEKEGNVEKLQLAREASIAAMEMMSPLDQLGVIGFDSAYKWVLPFAPISNPKSAAARIASMRPGGGTSLYPGLKEAIETLARDQSPVHHVIVLTDGMVEPADFESLCKRAAQDKITISTVAVGSGADVRFLAQLAAMGKGHAYLANEATLLPRIFTRETVLASRNAFVEEPTRVGVGDSHSILRGIPMAGAPPLGGYNLVSSKGSPAQVLLVSDQDDPVLAAGRYGLGKVVAYMGDNGSRWGKSWSAWAPFADLLTQSVRWTLPEVDNGAVRVNLERGADDRWKLLAESAGGNLEVGLVSPQGKSRRLALTQTGPERFEADLDLDESGTWLYHVNSDDGASVTRSFTLPYSRELSSLESRHDVLQAVAAAGGGRFNPGATEVFGPVSSAPRFYLEIWPHLLLAALLLLPIEVAVRRVMLPEGWWKRKPATPSAQVETASALLSVKEKTRKSHTRRPAAEPLIVETPPPPEKKPAAQPGSTTDDALSRLKKAKDRAKKEP